MADLAPASDRITMQHGLLVDPETYIKGTTSQLSNVRTILLRHRSVEVTEKDILDHEFRLQKSCHLSPLCCFWRRPNVRIHKPCVAVQIPRGCASPDIQPCLADRTLHALAMYYI